MSLSFGRKLLGATPDEAFRLDFDAKGVGFEDVDQLLDALIRRSLGGERIAVLTRTRARGFELALQGITGGDRIWIDKTYSLDALQSHGFWSTPKKASLPVGLLSTTWSLRERGRFGPQIAAEERGSVPLDTPEAIAVWSLLAPAVRALYEPIFLRTVNAGTGTRAEQIAAWGDVAESLEWLGVPSLAAFEVIRYGGGWVHLTGVQRHEVLLAYCEAVLAALPPNVGTRMRIRLTRPLLRKYYARAKEDGTALQKRVVTAALRPILAGIWGGSWLSFVNYLGEELHPREHVATAIPSATITASVTADIAAVAEKTGSSTKEVAAIAALVFGPKHEADRIAVLRQFWKAFDEIHARQAPGMTPLWGLVDDGYLGPPTGDGPYHPGLYRILLQSTLNDEIDSLWGGHMWHRFPDRVVTEWSAHARMADAFGPALSFWQGVALTAWFICEGPSSRTDFPDLPEYHGRELAALEDAGAPIDADFLGQISKADRLLGSPEEIPGGTSTIVIEGSPFSATVQMGFGLRRPGFESVRDLITRARRAWAERHLDPYLKQRWKSSIQKSIDRYHIAVNTRSGKPPTAKAFAREAADTVNLWLGGDFGGMYRLLQEKNPLRISDGRRITGPPHVVLVELHAALVSVGDPASSHQDHMAHQLLKVATSYVRWFEATGEYPSMDRFREFQYYADNHFGNGLDASWKQFCDVVHQVCLQRGGP